MNIEGSKYYYTNEDVINIINTPTPERHWMEFSESFLKTISAGSFLQIKGTQLKYVSDDLVQKLKDKGERFIRSIDFSEKYKVREIDSVANLLMMDDNLFCYTRAPKSCGEFCFGSIVNNSTLGVVSHLVDRFVKRYKFFDTGMVTDENDYFREHSFPAMINRIRDNLREVIRINRTSRDSFLWLDPWQTQLSRLDNEEARWGAAILKNIENGN